MINHATGPRQPGSRLHRDNGTQCWGPEALSSRPKSRFLMADCMLGMTAAPKRLLHARFRTTATHAREAPPQQRIRKTQKRGNQKLQLFPTSVPLVRGRERPPSQRYSRFAYDTLQATTAGGVALQEEHSAETGAALALLSNSYSSCALSACLPCVHLSEAIS
jgi:hypothetical protein